MKLKRSPRPKNLETKSVARALASGDWIDSKQGLKTQVSVHRFRKTRQPWQLMVRFHSLRVLVLVS